MAILVCKLFCVFQFLQLVAFWTIADYVQYRPVYGPETMPLNWTAPVDFRVNRGYQGGEQQQQMAAMAEEGMNYVAMVASFVYFMKAYVQQQMC